MNEISAVLKTSREEKKRYTHLEVGLVIFCYCVLPPSLNLSTNSLNLGDKEHAFYHHSLLLNSSPVVS